LKASARDHGINAELIKSLTSWKEEARANIGFFKRMMFVTNGSVMTVGLAITGFRAHRIFDRVGEPAIELNHHHCGF